MEKLPSEQQALRDAGFRPVVRDGVRGLEHEKQAVFIPARQPEAHEQATLVCTRTSSPAYVAGMQVVGVCGRCGESVKAAPSGQAQLAQTPLLLLCLECWLNEVKV